MSFLNTIVIVNAGPEVIGGQTALELHAKMDGGPMKGCGPTLDFYGDQGFAGSGVVGQVACLSDSNVTTEITVSASHGFVKTPIARFSGRDLAARLVGSLGVFGHEPPATQPVLAAPADPEVLSLYNILLAYGFIKTY